MSTAVIYARNTGGGRYQTTRPYSADVVNFWERQALAEGWTDQYQQLLDVFGTVGPKQGADPTAYTNNEVPATTPNSSFGSAIVVPVLGAIAVALLLRRKA